MKKELSYNKKKELLKIKNIIIDFFKSKAGMEVKVEKYKKID